MNNEKGTVRMDRHTDLRTTTLHRQPTTLSTEVMPYVVFLSSSSSLIFAVLYGRGALRVLPECLQAVVGEAVAVVEVQVRQLALGEVVEHTVRDGAVGDVQVLQRADATQRRDARVGDLGAPEEVEVDEGEAREELDALVGDLVAAGDVEVLEPR